MSKFNLTAGLACELVLDLKSIALLFLSCLSVVCAAQTATPSPQSTGSVPTYSEKVAAIIYEKCSICHRPEQVGPFSLLTFDDVKRHAETIKVAVGSNYMPPWKVANHNLKFANDRSLSDSEKHTLLEWIEAGCPQADPATTPSLPKFPEGWSLGKPDLIVKMQGQFKVPADGPDVYRSFVFPLALPEDKWVKAVELRSAASSSMHHALFFLDDSGQARKQDAADGQAGFAGMGFLAAGAALGSANESSSNLIARLRGIRQTGQAGDKRRIDEALARGLGGYVPGSMPSLLPGDLAMALPQGSDIIMQTHFHPSGKPEIEQAELGLYLADQPPSRQLVNIQVPPLFGFGAGIDIPPGEKKYRVTEEYTLPVDVEAIAVGGHAHYLCRTMQLVARLPSGQKIELLRIDDWDLDWQDRYIFANPILLPAGTILLSEIVYDNSSDNPENPYSPPRRVRWGRQSNDEMGSVTLAVVARDESKRPQLLESLRELFTNTVISRTVSKNGLDRLLLQLDENRDGVLQPDEAPPRLSGPIFKLLDKNADGGLDGNELQELTSLIETMRGANGGGK